MTQKFLQNFRKKHSYIRERIRLIPMQAATPFEQKILNGVVFGTFMMTIGVLPTRWVDRLDTVRHRPPLKPKIRFRLTQFTLLLWFIPMAVFAFNGWTFLMPGIHVFINNPSVAMEYKPNTIGHPSHLLLAWPLILLSICVIGMAIIVLRLKNVPLLLRVSIFCLTSAVMGPLNPIWNFKMPIAIWLGGQVLSIILVSMGAFCALLCIFFVDKWGESGLYFKRLPMDETNES